MKDKMSEETKYELNVYCRQLNKDLTNLMDRLRKQDEDNKAILYEGRHLKKVILPYEEYQKMYKRLESIDNANPSEALNITKATEKYTGIDLSIIKQALIKAQEQEKENAELKRALEIIKEKDVDIFMLNDLDTLEEYNGCISKKYGEYYQLTQEEFELLKRWLGNE